MSAESGSRARVVRTRCQNVVVVTRIIPNYNRFYRNSTINISKQSMNSREQQTDLRTKDFYGFGGQRILFFKGGNINYS